MSDEYGTEAVLLKEIGKALEPVGEAAVAAGEGKPEPLRTVLEGMGLGPKTLDDSWPAVKARIQELGESWKTIYSVVIEPIENDTAPDLTRLPDVFEAIGDVFGVIGSLDDVPVPDPEVDNLGERVVDYILITYLRDNYTLVYAGFALLGVIDTDTPRAAGDLDLSRLGPALANPNQAIREAFAWGTDSFEPYVVVFFLKEVIHGMGWDPGFEPVTDWMKTEVQGLDGGESWPGVDTSGGAPEEYADDRAVVDVFTISMDDVGNAGVDLSIVPVPGKHGDLPGLAVVPRGFATGETSAEIEGGWTFNAEFSAEANWALRVRPKGGGGVDTVPNRGVGEELHGEAELTYDGSSGSGRSVADDGEGTGVTVDYFQAALSIDYDGETVVFDVAFPIRGTFQTKPPDGFLGEVLPGESERSFDMEVGWGSEGGFYMERGQTLEASIPLQGKLGPALLEELYVDLGSVEGGGGGDSHSGRAIESGQLAFTTALTGTIELGPVTARFERLGITATQQGEGSNPADVAVDFRFPDGIGIEIATDSVSGGGYLQYDPDRERYAGVLQLQLSEFTVNAIGLLTTELPDGSDGFSLLVVLNADDLGIQLGAGFVFDGVGGMLGVNRTVRTKRIGTAVQEGAVDKLFFPENPVANADRIVSDLGSFFPPRRGHHVIGPVAKLSWLSILSGRAGVALELPSGKFVLVGVIGGGLPDADSDLISLNMAFSGYLDPPNSRLAIDATLFDSRVLAFTIKGDMALRANWGSNPRFLLSIGGWNPRYDPPGDFPELDRVSAVLGERGGNPRLELTGYMAITSNTFQVGAKVYALAEAGPAKAEGHLSFDALFQFSPFKFVIDFSASLSVTVYGYGLSIGIDGTLMGPGPFRVQGTLHIEILFISISVGVDVTIGPSKGREKLPKARVLPDLTDALSRPANWTAGQPTERIEWASLRSVETGDDEVLAHPTATIGVRQQVVPLAFEIEKFRNARPSGYDTFRIDRVLADGSQLADAAEIREQFAPAKYTRLSNEQKMNSPAFESHVAGRRVSHEGIYCGYDDPDKPRADSRPERNVRTTTFQYECSVVDRPRGHWGTRLSEMEASGTGTEARSGLTVQQARALSRVGAVASGRERAGERFAFEDIERRAIEAQRAGEPMSVPESEAGADDSREDGAAGDASADSQAAAESAASTGRAQAQSDGGQRQVVRGGPTPEAGGLSGPVSLSEQRYVVVDAETMGRVRPAEGDLSKAEAERALGRLREEHPAAADRLQVVVADRARPRAGGMS
jgi:hypothetical protein